MRRHLGLFWCVPATLFLTAVAGGVVARSAASSIEPWPGVTIEQNGWTLFAGGAETGVFAFYRSPIQRSAGGFSEVSVRFEYQTPSPDSGARSLSILEEFDCANSRYRYQRATGYGQNNLSGPPLGTDTGPSEWRPAASSSSTKADEIVNLTFGIVCEGK